MSQSLYETYTSLLSTDILNIRRRVLFSVLHAFKTSTSKSTTQASGEWQSPDIAADADLSFILTILTLNLNQKCLCVLHAWQTDQHLQSDQSDQLHQAIAYLFR